MLASYTHSITATWNLIFLSFFLSLEETLAGFLACTAGKGRQGRFIWVKYAWSSVQPRKPRIFLPRKLPAIRVHLQQCSQQFIDNIIDTSQHYRIMLLLDCIVTLVDGVSGDYSQQDNCLVCVSWTVSIY